MAKQAIGILETKGLVSLVQGTDAMLKAANVQLTGPTENGTEDAREGHDGGRPREVSNLFKLWKEDVEIPRSEELRAGLGQGEGSRGRTRQSSLHATHEGAEE